MMFPPFTSAMLVLLYMFIMWVDALNEAQQPFLHQVRSTPMGTVRYGGLYYERRRKVLRKDTPHKMLKSDN